MILDRLSHAIPGGAAYRPLLVTDRGVPAATVLLNAASTTGGTTQATASATPTANRLQIAYVASAAAAAPSTPTCTGQGLTWVQVQTSNFVAGNRRLTVFRAMGPSPTAGALTFDFAGQTQTSVAWGQIEFSGVDTSGSNGSGAVIQAPTPTTVGAGVASIAAPTLSALEHANNVNLTIELITPVAMDKGLRFAIREGGRTVGAGTVTEILQ